MLTIKRIAFTVLRVWLGIQWIEAGLHKLGSAAWTGANAGAGLAGFVNGSVAKAAGEHPAVQGWYAGFLKAVVLPNATLFGYTVAWGETLVGIGLILGTFTGFAALAGAFMNLNFMLAGSTSSNPILYTAAIVILAGLAYTQYFALDAYVRPRVEQAAEESYKRVKMRLRHAA